MALPLPTSTLPQPSDSPGSEISQVCLARPEPLFADGRDGFSEEAELDEATGPRELNEPPCDLAEFIGARWGLNADTALALLCDWLSCYQPHGDYAAAIGAGEVSAATRSAGVS